MAAAPACLVMEVTPCRRPAVHQWAGGLGDAAVEGAGEGVQTEAAAGPGEAQAQQPPVCA